MSLVITIIIPLKKHPGQVPRGGIKMAVGTFVPTNLQRGPCLRTDVGVMGVVVSAAHTALLGNPIVMEETDLSLRWGRSPPNQDTRSRLPPSPTAQMRRQG